MVYFFTTSERGIIATATENLLTKEDIEKLKEIFLNIYANPIESKKTYL